MGVEEQVLFFNYHCMQLSNIFLFYILLVLFNANQ
jgi:hypothetical protein